MISNTVFYAGFYVVHLVTHATIAVTNDVKKKKKKSMFIRSITNTFSYGVGGAKFILAS